MGDYKLNIKADT